jgi:hypothetical protein
MGLKTHAAAASHTVEVHNAPMTTQTAPAFQPLTGTFEPSAIQQLPDGRFLVVEDEKSHPFSVLTIDAAGGVEHSALRPGLLQMFSTFWALDDLEGLTLGRNGMLYAITSHSRNDDGKEDPAREKLVCFRIDGEHVVSPMVVGDLKRVMTATHPVLAAAAKIKEVKSAGGLNIEALEITPDQQRLLIGFRSPLRDGRALIASIDNPTGIFAAGEAPRMSAALAELDLGGHGIRALSYIPALGDYLVIGGPVSREPAQFDLWRWSGQEGAPARRVTVPGLQGLEHAEGISAAVFGGVEKIVIVSDDGSRKARRHASYVLLDPGMLKTAP